MSPKWYISIAYSFRITGWSEANVMVGFILFFCTQYIRIFNGFSWSFLQGYWLRSSMYVPLHRITLHLTMEVHECVVCPIPPVRTTHLDITCVNSPSEYPLLSRLTIREVRTTSLGSSIAMDRSTQPLIKTTAPCISRTLVLLSFCV